MDTAPGQGVDALQANIPSSLSEVDSVHAKESNREPSAMVSTARPKDVRSVSAQTHLIV